MTTSIGQELLALPDELPTPGSGRTAERFETLWRIASRSPSLARLAEAHFDGAAILREAGLEPPAGVRYAVWAASGPSRLTLDGRRLSGIKHWCSGASIATHALVTAAHGDTNALVLVALDRKGVLAGSPDWQSPAFATVDTRTVSFDLELDADDVIATDDWYLTRPGFWYGAVGVAACWAGCAAGIVERLLPDWRDDPHALAHLGAIDAAVWSARTVVDAAAADIDRDAALAESDGSRRSLALRVRHLVDAAADEIGQRAMRAVGPGPLAHRAGLHVEFAELELYRRQCHAERDLEQLGIAARDAHGRSRPSATAARGSPSAEASRSA